MIHATIHHERTERRLPLRAKRCAFTIIELLVAVAIIIVLLSLVLVGLNAATKASQRASTVSLMNSIKQGMVRFREDTGYYPPVLGPGTATLRDLFVPPAQGSATYEDDIQEWYSTCAFAEFLIGWDEGRFDGYGRGPNSPAHSAENPPTGIRDPGDGLWGAMTIDGNGNGTLGELADRDPPNTGKPLGPYIDLKDERLLAGVYYPPSGGGVQTYFAGDALPAGVTWESLPKAIVDYWGMPIRYYRRPYPVGALDQSHRAGTDINGDLVIDQDDIVPTLSDVYVLRPWTIASGSEVTTRFADGANSAVTTHELQTGEFALLSSGPDKELNEQYTVDLVEPDDDNEYNKDNIVEVGP